MAAVHAVIPVIRTHDTGRPCVRVHCGHHNYLLRQVLKKEWDFDGFVMSDFCWGVRDTVEAANGGQDMEMMWTQFFGKRLVQR